MIKMKLLLIPFPQISSYFNQGGKFNEILAFLKKTALFTVVLAGKVEGLWRSPIPSVGKRICLVCFCVHSYAGPWRWDRATKEKGCSMEKEMFSLLGPSRN